MNKTYIPLYRKYRPQCIEEIVGQEHIKKALANAIEMKRISHAYLFTGPRGTGKTSTARIFAKSLNCAKGISVSPCNECENCKNITNSIPIDVIEIDAASNRSVNDAEEIIQNVAMAPVHSRYKIYIIDEVHMLTPTAFNALLKTLEEPPENVIFILATTEVHKVLDTIKSRCQRFDFKRITTSDIAKHLRYISDKENINITDEALLYIAQNSAGGMRDSIALLDQLSVLNSADTQISVEDINRLLGRLSFNDLNLLFRTICDSNQQNAIEKLNEIYNQGNEPSQILSNFLEFLRSALIIKSVGGKTSGVIQLNEEQIKILTESVNNIETCQIVSLIDKCSAYIKELKLTSNPKLWLDVAILDMANLAQNTKLEELQKRLSLLEGGEVKIQPAAIKPIQSPTIQNPTVEKPQEKSAPASAKAPAPTTAFVQTAPAPKPTDATAQPQKSNNALPWEDFLSNISSVPSATMLKQQAVAVKIASDEVILTVKNPIWLKRFAQGGDKYPFLEEAAKKMFGDMPKIVVRAPQAGDSKIRSQQSETSDSQSTPPSAKTLEVENTPPQSETYESVEAEKSDEEPKIITKIPQSEAGFHSDNVNMVMEVFEGKIIE